MIQVMLYLHFGEIYYLHLNLIWYIVAKEHLIPLSLLMEMICISLKTKVNNYASSQLTYNETPVSVVLCADWSTAFLLCCKLRAAGGTSDVIHRDLWGLVNGPNCDSVENNDNRVWTLRILATASAVGWKHIADFMVLPPCNNAQAVLTYDQQRNLPQCPAYFWKFNLTVAALTNFAVASPI